MKIVASTPAPRAAHATACPWLPALAATTPAARSASSSSASLLTAPRSLNDPVRWRFSAFRDTSRPAMRENVSEPKTGVTRTAAPTRSRAASIAARSGASIAAFDPDPPLQHLLHRRQRIKPPLLDVGEQPRELRVAGDRALEVRLRARRGQREHLRSEPPPPRPLELAGGLEERAVRLDRGPQLVDARLLDRLGEHDRDRPAVALQHECRAQLLQLRLRGRMVALVDRDHVRDLHHARLQRLDRVARARHEHEDDRVRGAEDADLALPDPDRLDEDHVLPGRVEDEHRLERRLRQPAEMAARAHRPDEDLRVEEVVGEPDPVAEQRTVRERA